MLEFIKHLQYARRYSKLFSYINSFNPHNSPPPCYKQRHKHKEVKDVAPNYTTCKWQNHNLNPSFWAPEPKHVMTAIYSYYTDRGPGVCWSQGRLPRRGNMWSHSKKFSESSLSKEVMTGSGRGCMSQGMQDERQAFLRKSIYFC